MFLFFCQLLQRGHSRVPVYKGTKNEIVGLLLVKNLIRLDPDDATPVRDVYRPAERALLASSIDEPLFDLLDKFQTGKSNPGLKYFLSRSKTIKRFLY